MFKEESESLESTLLPFFKESESEIESQNLESAQLYSRVRCWRRCLPFYTPKKKKEMNTLGVNLYALRHKIRPVRLVVTDGERAWILLVWLTIADQIDLIDCDSFDLVNRVQFHN